MTRFLWLGVNECVLCVETRHQYDMHCDRDLDQAHARPPREWGRGSRSRCWRRAAGHLKLILFQMLYICTYTYSKQWLCTLTLFQYQFNFTQRVSLSLNMKVHFRALLDWTLRILILLIVKLRVRVRVKCKTSKVKTRPWGRGCNGLAHRPPTTRQLFLSWKLLIKAR